MTDDQFQELKTLLEGIRDNTRVSGVTTRRRFVHVNNRLSDIERYLGLTVTTNTTDTGE